MKTESTFFIEPFVDEGLGNSAYLVGSHASKTAMMIDPLRDVDRYRYAAERLSVQITHVLDTHLHNDFISGARELAAQTGAVIGASAAAGLGFDHRPLVEGDTLPLGELTLKVLATPGHTPEHISFTVSETEAKTPAALFSGGALIVGGAARTDLLGHDLCVPLARHLYHTLHHKLLTLPDEVGVYPTHGAGSFCVAPASPNRTTTIGLERRTNPLAQARDEAEFVEQALSGLPSYPVYYKEMRPLNQHGPKLLGGLPVLKPLAPDEVHAHMERGVAVLDVRPRQAFAQGHITGAYGIEVKAPLTTWAGWLIPFGTPLILVAATDAERQAAVRQLIRIGFDDFVGHLEGGVEAWARAGLPTAQVQSISAVELRERLNRGEAMTVLDVRRDDEWEAGHIPGAVHVEAGRLAWDHLPLPAAHPIAVHCAVGARSMVGISVLARRGYTDLLQVKDGFGGWRASGFEVERE